MTDELLRTLQGKLRARAVELEALVRALQEEARRPAAPGEGDQGTGACASGNAEARRYLRQAEHELEEVRAALARIEHPDYGICRACGEPIEIRHLRASPQVRVCLACRSSAPSRTRP